MLAVADVSRVEAAETVTWQYDPWAEKPQVAWIAAIAALLLCVLVVNLEESFLVSVGLCLFCVGAFAPALSRVECRIDPNGVARRGWLGWERRDWSMLRRMDRLPAGVLVSPYSKRNLLDSARGMVLPMPANRREELTRLVTDALERSR